MPSLKMLTKVVVSELFSSLMLGSILPALKTWSCSFEWVGSQRPSLTDSGPEVPEIQSG